MNNIYLDASATTPPNIEVINRIKYIQSECWGNPSSIHNVGIIARDILERSRLLIANKLKADPYDILFTSGATESNSLAINGICNKIDKGRIVISSVEHSSINIIASMLQDQGWEIIYWPVDRYGIINLDLMNELLSPPTKLVSIIWGQSEIGSVQPINIIGEACQQKNIIFHTDATQILPSGLIDWGSINVDLLSASAHKLQGPKGIGLLMMRKHIKELLISGNSNSSHQSSIRPGTESVPLIAGFATAISLLNEYIVVEDHETHFPVNKVSEMTLCLKDKLLNNKQLTFIGPHNNRLPNNLSFLCHTDSMMPIKGREIVRELSRKNVYVSSGSACSSSNKGPNPTLVSIDVDKSLQESGLRISIGPWIDHDQINDISNRIKESLYNLQLQKS
tara:strand:+ start:1537 stop:2718 length:1182 start_codon:yes stop_codon:yes gene_type:complete